MEDNVANSFAGRCRQSCSKGSASMEGLKHKATEVTCSLSASETRETEPRIERLQLV